MERLKKSWPIHIHLSLLYCFFFHKTNKHSTDWRSQLNNPNAGQYRTVRNSALHMFYILYSGVRSKSGEQIRPIAERTLKGPPVVEGRNNFFRGSYTVGGRVHICASLNFRAQVHICARYPHTCMLDSILVWSLRVALILRWLLHSSFFPVRKNADSRQRASWLCTFSIQESVVVFYVIIYRLHNYVYV